MFSIGSFGVPCRTQPVLYRHIYTCTQPLYMLMCTLLSVLFTPEAPAFCTYFDVCKAKWFRVSTLRSGRLTISLKYGHHLSNKAHSSHPESYEQTNYFIICDTDVFLRYWQCFVTHLSISLLWVCTYYRCLHLNECSLCYYCSYN